MRTYCPRLPLITLLVSGLLIPLSTLSYFTAAGARGVNLQPLPRATQAEPGERLNLGVLEHNDSEGRKGHSVRVAFYKEDGQWKTYPTTFNTEAELSRAVKSFPEEVAWTVCFDGRSSGSLTSKNPESVLF